MKHISIDISELNDNRVLSPEYWISKNIAASHSGSVSLGDLFFLSKKQPVAFLPMGLSLTRQIATWD